MCQVYLHRIQIHTYIRIKVTENTRKLLQTPQLTSFSVHTEREN